MTFRKPYSYTLIFAIFCIHSVAYSQSKLRMVGGARSVLNNQSLETFDSITDKTTPKAKVGGYSLIDLGFNISPNKQTEIMGMIRIKNQYGGFFGGGVTFDVRQLWIKAILGDVLRYQLGDINLKQTPFTLFNHNEDLFLNQNPSSQIFQDIVNYESFYKQNTWRQQGLSTDFGLNFSKYIDEVNFNGYLTRMNMTNFSNVPERLLGGATVDIVINDKLSLQYNNSSIFDVTGTAVDSNSFRNLVHTGAFMFKNNFFGLPVELKSEIGTSNTYYTIDPNAPSLSDYFIHPTINIESSNHNLQIKVGYLNVGPNFRSPGAQSKRIDYQGTLTNFPLYRQSQMDRPYHLQDLLQDERLYKVSISSKLMAYNPIINNVLPYGLATFNRNGLYGTVSYKNNAKNSEINFSHYQLNEIIGQGTKNLKSFSMTQLQFNTLLNNFFKWKKNIKFTSTILHQQTSRTSEFDYELIDLNSLQIAAGLEWEFVKDFDFILGYNFLKGKGNEMISSRNGYTEVIDFEKYASNIEQSILGIGLKFKFSKQTYLALIHQQYHHSNELNGFENYKMQQTNIIYNLIF